MVHHVAIAGRKRGMDRPGVRIAGLEDAFFLRFIFRSRLHGGADGWRPVVDASQGEPHVPEVLVAQARPVTDTEEAAGAVGFHLLAEPVRKGKANRHPSLPPHLHVGGGDPQAHDVRAEGREPRCGLVLQFAFEGVDQLVQVGVEVVIQNQGTAYGGVNRDGQILVFIGRLHLIVSEEVVAGRVIPQEGRMGAHEDRHLGSQLIQLVARHPVLGQVLHADACPGAAPRQVDPGPLPRQRMRHAFLDDQLDALADLRETLAAHGKSLDDRLILHRIVPNPAADRMVVHVGMRVNQAGNHCAAIQINLPRRGAGVAQHLRAAAYELDEVPAHGHSLHGSSGRVAQGGVIHGDNLAVVNDQVRVCRQLRWNGHGLLATGAGTK